MLCQAIRTDSYRVVVKFPLSRPARCRLCLSNCLQCLTDVSLDCRTDCVNLVKVLTPLCVGLLILLVGFSYAWIIILMNHCQEPPMLALEDLSVRSMTVYQNYTVAAPEDQWQVQSEFNVTLSAWNPNTVAGCFSTYRRMVVYVGYHDKLILQQKVPLGFGLKPRRSRPVVVGLKGDHFPVTEQLGQLLDAELRNASSVNLQIYFDTRVMRNDRKASWIRMGCQVTARTPTNSSQVSGNLLSKSCRPS